MYGDTSKILYPKQFNEVLREIKSKNPETKEIASCFLRLTKEDLNQGNL